MSKRKGNKEEFNFISTSPSSNLSSYSNNNSLPAPTSPTTIRRQRNVRVSTEREERKRNIGESMSEDTMRNMKFILDEISDGGGYSRYDTDSDDNYNYNYDSDRGMNTRKDRARDSDRDRDSEREDDGRRELEIEINRRSDKKKLHSPDREDFTGRDRDRENDRKRERGRERGRERYKEEEYDIETRPSSSSFFTSFSPMPPHPPQRFENNTSPGLNQIGTSPGGYSGQRSSMWRSVSTGENSKKTDNDNDIGMSNNSVSSYSNNSHNINNSNNDNNDINPIDLLFVAEKEVINLRESLKIEKKYNESLESQLLFSVKKNIIDDDINTNPDSIQSDLYKYKNKNDGVNNNFHDVRDDSNGDSNLGQKTYSTFMKETAEEILLPEGEGEGKRSKMMRMKEIRREKRRN